MAAVSDLKQALSSHLLLLISLCSYLCLEEGMWGESPGALVAWQSLDERDALQE